MEATELHGAKSETSVSGTGKLEPRQAQAIVDNYQTLNWGFDMSANTTQQLRNGVLPPLLKSHMDNAHQVICQPSYMLLR